MATGLLHAPAQFREAFKNFVVKYCTPRTFKEEDEEVKEDEETKKKVKKKRAGGGGGLINKWKSIMSILANAEETVFSMA